MKKPRYTNEIIYEACCVEHQKNPQVLTLFKPTLDFIVERFKYSPATAWTKLQNLIREYDLNLAPTLKGLPYLTPERGLVINYFNLSPDYKKNGYPSIYLKVRTLKKQYQDEDKIRKELFDWWKTWKYKDFYEPIYPEQLSDRNTITLIRRPKTKPECKSECSESELNDLCS